MTELTENERLDAAKAAHDGYFEATQRVGTFETDSDVGKLGWHKSALAVLDWAEKRAKGEAKANGPKPGAYTNTIEEACNASGPVWSVLNRAFLERGEKANQLAERGNELLERLCGYFENNEDAELCQQKENEIHRLETAYKACTAERDEWKAKVVDYREILSARDDGLRHWKERAESAEASCIRLRESCFESDKQRDAALSRAETLDKLLATANAEKAEWKHNCGVAREERDELINSLPGKINEIAAQRERIKNLELDRDKWKDTAVSKDAERSEAVMAKNKALDCHLRVKAELDDRIQDLNDALAAAQEYRGKHASIIAAHDKAVKAFQDESAKNRELAAENERLKSDLAAARGWKATEEQVDKSKPKP